MTIDPVCNMKANEATALQLAYQGKTYYFCSVVCKALFERDPEKCIQQQAEAKNNEE